MATCLPPQVSLVMSSVDTRHIFADGRRARLSVHRGPKGRKEQDTVVRAAGGLRSVLTAEGRTQSRPEEVPQAARGLGAPSSLSPCHHFLLLTPGHGGGGLPGNPAEGFPSSEPLHPLSDTARQGHLPPPTDETTEAQRGVSDLPRLTELANARTISIRKPGMLVPPPPNTSPKGR